MRKQVAAALFEDLIIPALEFDRVERHVPVAVTEQKAFQGATASLRSNGVADPLW
jgi:hypothetical protein